MAGIGAIGLTLVPILAGWAGSIYASQLFTLQLALAVVTLWLRYRRLPTGPARQQIRWAMLGFALSMVAAALLTVERTIMNNTASLSVLMWCTVLKSVFDVLNTFLLVGGLTLGLLRYRLYGADTAISRSVAYGALTVGLLGVFAASEKGVELVGERWLGGSLGAVSGAVAAAVAALAIVPFHHRLTRWAEGRFRGALVRLRDKLPPLVGDLRATCSPQQLASVALERIEAGTGARHGAVVARNGVVACRQVTSDEVTAWLATAPARHEGFVLARADPLFPVQVSLHADGPGEIGLLLLGSRPDGTMFSREERDVLAGLADPLARALAVALDRRAREAEREHADHSRDEEIGALKRLVQRLEERLGVAAGQAPASS